MSKWHCSDGFSGTITVVSSKTIQNGGGTPGAYIIADPLWLGGPGCWDTQNIARVDPLGFVKVWPDEYVEKDIENVIADKDGNKTTERSKEKVLVSTWRDKLEAWLVENAKCLGFAPNWPTRPVAAVDLTEEERKIIEKHRKETQVGPGGKVIQQVKHGSRTV